MSQSNEQQMEAVVIQAAGPPAQSLAIRSEPVPEPGPGEVLVEVHAAAVNPLDAVNALGLLGTPLPMIPGVDFAGVVVSDGDRAGQEVWGSAPQVGMQRPGTHARFVALPETWLSRRPGRLSMSEAAAIGRSHLAAWETLIESGRLEPGETILITGGAGMVGQAAAAIARWRGARPIIADVRRPDGVEQFIDAGAGDLHEAVLEITDGRGVDMVLDGIGGALFEPALRSVRFGGRMIGLISHEPRVEFDLVEFYGREVRLSGLASVFLDGAHVAHVFDQLGALFDSGALVAPSLKTWSLEDAADAYQSVLDGSAGVKQVLAIGGRA
ncbi:MAG: quinone oxidoreductase family protein [Solirubrobacterales bacterium]